MRTVLKVPLEKAAPLALLTFRNLWLQRRKRYRSTNWTIFRCSYIRNSLFICGISLFIFSISYSLYIDICVNRLRYSLYIGMRCWTFFLITHFCAIAKNRSASNLMSQFSEIISAFILGYRSFSYEFHFNFCKQEMRYCSDDAPWTGERNVNLNKNTSENVASNKAFLCCNE